MAVLVGQGYKNRRTGSLYKVYHVETFKRSKAIPNLGEVATVIYLELTKRRLMSFDDSVLITITEDHLTKYFMPWSDVPSDDTKTPPVDKS